MIHYTGPKWVKFKIDNDNPRRYEFGYMPHLDHRQPPTVGIRWLCCDMVGYDELPDDIENLDDKTWKIVQDNLKEDAEAHGYIPCKGLKGD